MTEPINAHMTSIMVKGWYPLWLEYLCPHWNSCLKWSSMKSSGRWGLMVGHLCHLSHHKMACRGRFALSRSPENCGPQCGKIASTGANTRSSPSQTPEPSNPFPSWVKHLLAFHYRSRDDSALCPWLTLCGAELLYSCEVLCKGHSLFCTYGHLQWSMQVAVIRRAMLSHNL